MVQIKEWFKTLSPQAFISFGVGLIIGVLFMNLAQIKPVNETELSIEAKARKQGMIYEGECRVNWGLSEETDESVTK